jgi:hypothetical protein
MRFQEIIESIEALSAEEQEYLWDLVRKRRIEHRREEIANHAEALKLDFKEGRAKQGTIDDLIADLLDDEDESSLE